MNQIVDALSGLNAKVAELTTVEQSAVALLQGLKAALDTALANATNPAEALAAIQAISDQLGTDTTELAAAVVANTPVAP